MYPQGFLGIDSYRLVMLLACFLCTALMFRLMSRNDVSPWRLLLLQLLIVGVSLAGGKLFSLYVRDWQVNAFLVELRTGWRYPGALIAMVIFGPLFKRWLLPNLSLLRYADLMGIAIATGYAIMRIGCFLTGCCTGAVNHSLGLSYDRGSSVWHRHLHDGLIQRTSLESLPVLPLHGLFMAASVVIACYLLWFDNRRRYDGQLFLLFLVLHEGAKGILESLRVPYISELQIASLSAAVIGFMLLIAIHHWRRQPLTPVMR